MTKPGIAGRPAAVSTDRNIWQRWFVRLETMASRMQQVFNRSVNMPCAWQWRTAFAAQRRFFMTGGLKQG